MNSPIRTPVLGSRISACDMGTALEWLARRTREAEGGYVCFTNAHTAVLGRRDPAFRSITNGSFLSLADGKPVYWVGRFIRGGKGIGHVPGPDLFTEALRKFPQAGHFFYGSTPEVLDRLVDTAQRVATEIKICGVLSPPFRLLTLTEKLQHYHTIRESGAAFVWVGLGAPKQEQWMAEAWREVQPSILLGVGAAFDFHAGTVRRAPAWMKKVGLEWLHRLAQEPKRLWKRYLVTNSLFICYLIWDRLTRRKETV